MYWILFCIAIFYFIRTYYIASAVIFFYFFCVYFRNDIGPIESDPVLVKEEDLIIKFFPGIVKVLAEWSGASKRYRNVLTEKFSSYTFFYKVIFYHIFVFNFFFEYFTLYGDMGAWIYFNMFNGWVYFYMLNLNFYFILQISVILFSNITCNYRFLLLLRPIITIFCCFSVYIYFSSINVFFDPVLCPWIFENFVSGLQMRTHGMYYSSGYEKYAIRQLSLFGETIPLTFDNFIDIEKCKLSPFYIKKEYHIKDVLVLFFSVPIRVFFSKFF